MSFSLRVLAPLATALALGVSASAADAPAAPTVIVNFTEAVPSVYGYGTWQNNFAVAPNAGFRVQGSKGAQGDGGFCKTIEPALDLSRCTFIELALAVQPGNEVPEYTISLKDADDTSCSARVRVSQIMPGMPVWFRLNVADFVVSSREQDRGKDGKMDWTKVVQWHLQGDWSTKKAVQMLFIALRAR
jgi:hypothetical protein